LKLVQNVGGLRSFLYEERHAQVRMFSVGRRRLEGGLIKTVTIVREFTKMRMGNTFRLAVDHPTRHLLIGLFLERTRTTKMQTLNVVGER